MIPEPFHWDMYAIIIFINVLAIIPYYNNYFNILKRISGYFLVHRPTENNNQPPIAGIPFRGALIVVVPDYVRNPSAANGKRIDAGYRLAIILDPLNPYAAEEAKAAGLPEDRLHQLLSHKAITFKRISAKDSATMYAHMDRFERELQQVWPALHQSDTQNDPEGNGPESVSQLVYGLKCLLSEDLEACLPESGCSPRKRRWTHGSGSNGSPPQQR